MASSETMFDIFVPGHRRENPEHKLTPTPWDETTSGLASAIRIIQLNDKLAVIETIFQLDLHNSWDRTHKALLLETCSQAYRTEKTFVEVVANTHRGIQNGTETVENLENWTRSLMEAEENSRIAEGEIENLRALLWDVIFNEKRAVATLGEREWSEFEEQVIKRRREMFERGCRRCEDLREDIKDAIIEEKRQVVLGGGSLLLTYNAPRNKFFPDERKYKHNNVKEDRTRAAINGTSLSNLEHLTPEQKSKYEDLQERWLMVQRRVDERTQRYLQSYSAGELRLPCEVSDSEDESHFDYSSSKRRRVNNVSIYEKVKNQFNAAFEYIANPVERTRTFEVYDASPTDATRLRQDIEANVGIRNRQRKRTREMEEARVANEVNMKHK